MPNLFRLRLGQAIVLLDPNSEVGVAESGRTHPSHVILRSPALWDDEGSPQFVRNIRWLAVRSNCRGFFGPQETGASE
jgi:hypothetical protein